MPPRWRLKCWSWAIDNWYKVCQLFDVRHSVKKDARHSIGLSSHWLIDAMSGIVFDAMSGVKKMTNFIHAINCPTSANEPSDKSRVVGKPDVLDGLVFWHCVQKLTRSLPTTDYTNSAYSVSIEGTESIGWIVRRLK